MATINGTSFADNLVGTSVADTINGRAGNDTIRGGGGRDTITTGSGRDTLVYTAITDSPFASNWDLINDFVRGDDRIDLSAFLGTADLTWGGLTATANGVWYSRSGTTVSIFIDTDGAPATPEMRIVLQNMSTTTVLDASDFTGVVVRTSAAPVFTSQANWTVNENGTAIGTVVATDADSPTVTYSLVNAADSARFSIDRTTGVLSFVMAPNFEAPIDAGTNNVYNFTVQASDGTLNTTQAVTVNVTNVNEAAPVFTSPTAAFNVAENSATVGTITATDADNTALAYSINGGADAARFAIDAATGALRFLAAPDFETPTDADANNSYNVTVQASDGTLTANQAVTVNVTNIVTESLTGDGNDNTLTGTAGNDVITGNGGADLLTGGGGNDVFVYLAATDTSPNTNWETPPDGMMTRNWDAITDFTPGSDRIDLSALLGATDLGWGGQNGNSNTVWYAKSGTSTFIYADVGGNGLPPPELMIEVRNTQTWVPVATNFIGVVGGSTGANAAPVFASPTAAFNVAENSATVGTVTATDADNTALAYSINGGADAARFAIDAATGALRFLAAPDFEAPTDADANNSYNVTVQASDGTSTANQAVTVNVTNVNEAAPVFASPTAAFNVAENSATVGTITATDADNTALAYSINGGTDAARFAIDAATGALRFLAAPDFEAPTDADANNSYNVTVQASDGTSTANQAVTVNVTNVNEAGAAPVFASPTAAFNVAENSATVGTITATDADNTALAYSINGGTDAARFAIDAATGALRFLAAPDFETPTDADANNSYNVTVQASDGTLTANQAVTVNVTNVNEAAPVFTSPTAAFNVAENSATVGTITATDADNTALAYSINGGADAARFAIDAATGALRFLAAPDFETPTDADANNSYNVTVQASDGTLTANQAVTVNVTNIVTESLTGDGNDNTLTGTAGNDVITGNGGADLLTGGGGNDVFVYLAATDTSPNTNWETPPDGMMTRNWDAITDFTPGSDRIDLSALLGATDLGWGGQNGNSNTVWYAKSGTSTFIYADVGGNGLPPPELMIEVRNTQTWVPVATNFIGVVGGSTGANAAPVFASPTAAFNVAENSATVGTVTATDADNTALAYSINGGTDAARFAIDAATGALRFLAAPDFEAPTDADANNSYNVTVQASDGTSTANQAVTVTVTDLAVEAIAGTSGNDTLPGTAGDDLIDISAGGNDTVTAASGTDTILAGAAFNATDRVDGGTELDDTNEIDALVLDGNYAAGVIFTTTTLTNVEEIRLAAGNSYNLTTNNATVVAASLAIDGSALAAANTLTVNASAETEAGSSYTMTGGAGNDVLTGGAGPDYFDISFGGNDIVSGGAGRDTIYAGAALTAAEQINGGAGTDFVYLNGNYSAGLTLGAATLVGVEAIVVQAGNNYMLTMNNAMLTGTQAATVDGYALGSGDALSVNASSETDSGTVYTLSGGAGNDNLNGGAGNDLLSGNAGNDILVGGAGNDILTGGAGNDTLSGGLGNDVFDYNVIADRGTTGDTISGFSRTGTNGVDVLNLHDLLLTFTGFNGNNAFTGGYLQFDTSSGTSTVVRADTTGGANSYVTLVTLTGTLLQPADTTNYVL